MIGGSTQPERAIHLSATTAVGRQGTLVPDRSTIDDRDALMDLAREFAAQGNPSAAYLCLVRASRLGEMGLGCRLAHLYQQAAARRQIPAQKNGGIDQATGCVSIVMPTRGSSAGIKESIHSVLQQTYPHWELWVVNDGGPEYPLQQVLAEFSDARVKYLYKAHCEGPSAARNAGLAAARGQWVAYLDDDDVFSPHHLETCVDILQRDRVELVFTRCHRVFGKWTQGRFVEATREPQKWPSEIPRVEHLLRHNFICTLNVVHSRDALNLTGGWDPGIRHLEDWEFWIRVATRFDMTGIPEFTGEYRIVRDPSCSDNVSVLQSEQMAAFEAMILEMLDDGRAFHRMLLRCRDRKERHLAPLIFEWLCDQAAAYPLGNLNTINSQMIALLRGTISGLRSENQSTALKKLLIRECQLVAERLQRHIEIFLSRYVTWRFRSLFGKS